MFNTERFVNVESDTTDPLDCTAAASALLAASNTQYSTGGSMFTISNSMEIPYCISVDPDDLHSAHKYRSMDPSVNYKALEKASAAFQISPGISVGRYFPCFIIAGVGENHQGDMHIAERLIDQASKCGADCVRFQKCDIRSSFTKNALSQPYDSYHSFGETFGDHLVQLEFTYEEFYRLKRYAMYKGILFTASARDMISVDFLHAIDVPFFKIGSSDCCNYPLLRYAAYYQKPMVISTGMHDFETISKMCSFLYPYNPYLALLQSTNAYPPPFDELNLNALESYKKKFPFTVVGYSGHERGIGISLAAVALGAKIVERHITLNREMKGTGQISSLEPYEFQQLVNELKRIEWAMRPNEKAIQESEAICTSKLAKTVVATRNLRAGTILEESMYELKVAYPKGWEAFNASELNGRRLLNDVYADCSILKSDIFSFLEPETPNDEHDFT